MNKRYMNFSASSHIYYVANNHGRALPLDR